MDILRIIILSVVSIAVMFIVTKLMGNKQLGQMSMFDYVMGITVGSIAAEMATGLDIEPLNNIIAMAVYGAVSVGISVVTAKSLAVRKLITGRPIILMERGKIYRANLKKARLDLSEFLTMCRVSGYYDITQIETAILESSGRLSILPRSTQRPVTPNDLGLNPAPERPAVSVIFDGHVLAVNLKAAGYDEKWLDGKLRAQNLNSSEVYLGIVDANGNLTAFKMIDEKLSADRFE